MPPAAAPTNSSPASTTEKLPPTAAATATRYATSAVASLTRLSPSITLTIRRGAPSRRMIAVAATGSVGETIAPSAKAIGQERPITSCPSTATTPGGREHEADGEQRDRPQVRAQRPQIGEEGRRVQERRQEDDAGPRPGRARSRAFPGSTPSTSAADHQWDRIRDRRASAPGRSARRRRRTGRRGRSRSSPRGHYLSPVSEEVVIGRRFNGPPDSAHGGYARRDGGSVLGLVAAVSLRMPPPLEQPLSVPSRRRRLGDAARR